MLDESLRRLRRAYQEKRIPPERYIAALERVLGGGSVASSDISDFHQGFLTYQGLLNRLLALNEEQLGMSVSIYHFDDSTVHGITSVAIDNSEEILDTNHPVLAFHRCRHCNESAPQIITQNLFDGNITRQQASFCDLHRNMGAQP